MPRRKQVKCTACGETDISKFYRYGDTAVARQRKIVGFPRSKCRDCEREYSKQRYKERGRADPGKKRFGVLLAWEVWVQVELEAKKRGVSKSAIIQEAVEKYVRALEAIERRRYDS